MMPASFLRTPEQEAALAGLNANGVPNKVTLYQGRVALVYAGVFDQVKAAVLSLGESSAAYQAFEYGNHWYRDSAFIAELASGLELSDAQVDALFIAASQIE